MKYEDPNLLDRLAREYVLGTLSGPARRRFEGIASGSFPARLAVAEWEQRLSPLALAQTPVTPPPQVWSAVERRLGFTGVKRKRSMWWRSLAAGLAAATIVLSLLYVTRQPAFVEARLVAIVAEDPASPIWLVRGFPEAQVLRLTAVGEVPLLPDQAYELWMLPGEDAAPVSLGLLPERNTVERKLTARELELLRATSTLAVSVEPPGGSPTLAPTGPVVFSARLVQAPR